MLAPGLLIAIDKQMLFEWKITMTEASFSNSIMGATDYNLINDEQLLRTNEQMLEAAAEEFGKLGITYGSIEVYQHSQAKFLVKLLTITEGETVRQGLQYNTCYDGKDIVITFNTFAGEVTEEQKLLLKEIVDSIVFDAEPRKAILDSDTIAELVRQSTEEQPEAQTEEPTVQPAEKQTEEPQKEQNYDRWAAEYLLSTWGDILLAAVICTGPILIYRFLIRKEPVSKKKAKTISIVYAIVTFILMTIVASVMAGTYTAAGGGILWCVLNYFILRDKDEGETVDE